MKTALNLRTTPPLERVRVGKKKRQLITIKDTFRDRAVPLRCAGTQLMLFGGVLSHRKEAAALVILFLSFRSFDRFERFFETFFFESKSADSQFWVKFCEGSWKWIRQIGEAGGK